MKSHLLIIISTLFSLNNSAQSGGIRIEGVTIIIASGSPKIVIENGDFHSDAAFFDIAQSEIIFTGNAGFDETTIGGTTFLNFYNLTIDKSVQGIKLKNHIYINNDLTFENGSIDLNGNTIYLPNNGKLMNEKETSRIIETDGGLVSKTMSLNAPNNANPGNLGARITSNKNLGITTITRGHNPQTGAGNEGIERHFDINPTNNDGLNATLRFNYLDCELNGIDETDLTIYRKENGDWEDMGFDNNDKEDNWMELFGIDHFSTWTLGSVTNALSIEWLSFTAKINNKKTIDLNWQTALEINNDYFIVEKSANGIDFFELGIVQSQGNSTEVQSYYFEDKNPFVGNNYYRLQQIDHTGFRSYSEIRLVNHLEKNFGLAVFPNPAKGQIQISFSLENAVEIEIRLSDVLGRNLKTLQTSTLFPNGQYVYNTDLTSFSKGMYFIDFQLDRRIIREKIIIQ